MSENPGLETRAGKLSFPDYVLGIKGYKPTRTWKRQPERGVVLLSERDPFCVSRAHAGYHG